MKKLFCPGIDKKALTLLDNIIYSRVNALNGNNLELKMSIMLQNGNSELRLATGEDDPAEDHSKKPALIWINGAGWRGADKNMMIGEMSFFADAGYVVASPYYRSSTEGHFPDQFVDVKTAIRFLRAHAKAYEIDPERIGIFGRSAGGHLATLAAMNLTQYESEEWDGYSSNVQAAIDMFGPLDLVACMEMEEERFKNPSYRWHSMEQTHWGALIGGEIKSMKERAFNASPIHYINEEMCPLQILHGDNDPIVPIDINADAFYEKIVEVGLEDRVEYYVFPHAGHGSREFFQDKTKKLMCSFFDHILK